jgi:beta-phosphoglucomutase
LSRLEGVIFDMDGVVIDSHPAHRRAWLAFLRALGKEVSAEELDFILDGRKRSDILHYFLGEMTDEEVAGLGKQKDELFCQAALELTPVSGVVEFLTNLKEEKIAVGLATSASAYRTRRTLDSLNLNKFFNVVVTGDEVQKGKPDPAIYQMACKKLGFDPKHSVAIEDAVSGIRAAHGAGLKCVGVARGPKQMQLLDAGAEGVIEDFQSFSPDRLKSMIRSPVS